MNKTIHYGYFLFLVLLVGFSYLFIDPGFFYLKKIYSGFFTSYRTETTYLFTAIITLFFVFFGLILWKIQKKAVSKDAFIYITAVSALLLSFAYPSMLSFDLFNYIATAKVAFFYFENPYIIMPIEFLGDTMLLFTHAPNKTALYGPFWILLSAIPYFLGFGNYVLTILTFKAFLALFYFGTIFLLWKFSRSLFSVALFALNPLVLVETFVSGHNDIVMICLSLFSIFFLLKKRIFIALAFLVASILIKYATFFLIPVIIYMIWKLYIQKEQINKEKLFTLTAAVMFVAFLLSPLREEIYPWYAIWFLPFIAISGSKKSLQYFSIVFSFCLLLRYTPFMYHGYHYGNTPFLKTLFTFVPISFFILYEWIIRKILFGKKRFL